MDITSEQGLRHYFTSIKAVAITGIFAYHFYDFSYVWGSVSDRFGEGILKSAFAAAQGPIDYAWGVLSLFFSFGNIGVELFIMASGFGLYSSYLKKRPPWAEFFKRRAVRLLPLYWLSVVVLYFFVLKEDATPGSFVYHMLLIQTLTGHWLDFGALWFVGYIVQLYLLFPFFTIVMRRKLLKWFFFAASFFLTPIYLGLADLLGFAAQGIPPTQFLPLFLFGMLVAGSAGRGGNLHRLVLSPKVSVASLLALVAAVFVIDSSPGLYGGIKGLMAVFAFSALALPLSRALSLAPVSKAFSLLCYSSYVLFLSHVGVFTKFMEEGIRGGWISGKIEGGMIYPVPGSGLFYIAVLCFALSLGISYMVQKAYDSLLRLFPKSSL